MERIDFTNWPLEGEMKYRDAIWGRMVADGARDVSDAEIERTLGPCVAGPMMVVFAKTLRNAGLLKL